MRDIFETVAMEQVVCEDKLPVNHLSFQLARFMSKGGTVPAIKVKAGDSGQWVIKDGRHRFVAHKLLDRAYIWIRHAPEEKIRAYRAQPPKAAYAQAQAGHPVQEGQAPQAPQEG